MKKTTFLFPHQSNHKETDRMKKCVLGAIGAAMIALTMPATTALAQTAAPWAIDKAAAPLKGTKIKVLFLDRPGYRALIKLLPEFEKKTGLKVEYEIVPYENAREKQVLNFSAKGDLTVALVDLVWIGEFAESGWIVPVDTFTKDAAITDPNLDLKGFFPLLLNAFGSWDGKVYGLPFDNYSGLMFYNQCMLKDAGFSGPPQTWDELKNVYAPKLTNPAKKQYAYALQSLRGETQSADSFMRFLWPFGGSLLDKDFKSNLASKGSQDGLKFRQDLMKYMPPGVVSYDHAEAVNALAQGQVAMLTEWSAFYGTLTDPKTSKLGDCLAVAPEPKGPAGRLPALGGFSLAVASQATPAQQKASWIFTQWATSDAIAKQYVEAGGVSGRMAVYKDPAIQAKFKYVKPMVESWQQGVPEFRPRFPAWSSITETVAEFGSKIMLGETSIEQGTKEISTRMESVLDKEGYYNGKKKKLQ